MKKIKQLVAIVIFILLASGMVSYFKEFLLNSDNINYAMQIDQAFFDEDYELIKSIVSKHPKSINTLPSYSPWWWQLITEQPGKYYPLQIACINGNYELVKLMIDNGADPNLAWKSIESSKTPLILTVKYYTTDSIKIAQLLLEHGADKSVIRSGYTAYDYAVEAEIPEIIELLKPKIFRLTKLIGF